ncbi:hypothetical protein CEXT_665931 [Caerostris extrusa]|uniref:Uncharacterized protein n=1 Tax=Caerostris extrusa TaxID=172846 RepID=A0AAV4RBR1_CAEEX|nr:hypothetical protein CEXT_665931 [Caerostris extrusa]
MILLRDGVRFLLSQATASEWAITLIEIVPLRYGDIETSPVMTFRKKGYHQNVLRSQAQIKNSVGFGKYFKSPLLISKK